MESEVEAEEEGVQVAEEAGEEEVEGNPLLTETWRSSMCPNYPLLNTAAGDPEKYLTRLPHQRTIQDHLKVQEDRQESTTRRTHNPQSPEEEAEGRFSDLPLLKLKDKKNLNLHILLHKEERDQSTKQKNLVKNGQRSKVDYRALQSKHISS